MNEYLQQKQMTREEIRDLLGKYSCSEDSCEKAFLWFAVIYMIGMIITLYVIIWDINPNLFEFF